MNLQWTAVLINTNEDQINSVTNALLVVAVHLLTLPNGTFL